jgi:serine/threonine-protein phosphatase 2B catalytic subunit
MLLAVLSICSEEELSETRTDTEGQKIAEMPALTPEEIRAIKDKILAVGKMHKVFHVLRFVLLLPLFLPVDH